MTSNNNSNKAAEGVEAGHQHDHATIPTAMPHHSGPGPSYETRKHKNSGEEAKLVTCINGT